MNWIKITPETELPEEDVLAINVNGKKAFGLLLRKKIDGTAVLQGKTILHYVTHFMIITNPEE